MRKYFTIILGSLLITLFAGLQWVISDDSKTERERRNMVDTRVDNNGYYKRLAEKGLYTLNPDMRTAEAIFTGSKINAYSVLTDDSPDVPVTEENSTQSENSIFVDPNNPDIVLQSNNSTQNPVGSLYGANDFYSFDYGETWLGEVQGAGGSNSGDPATAIGLNGRWYVNYISNPGGQGVAYSDDQGDSWTTRTISPNPGSLADKNHFWIDNSLSSPYEGNLYNVWSDFGGPYDAEIVVSYSTDDGDTWTPRTPISTAVNAGSHNQGVNVNTGPNGEVYAVWAIYNSWPSDEGAIGFSRSFDGGETWEDATRIIENIRGIRTTETGKNHRVNSFPVMFSGSGSYHSKTKNSFDCLIVDEAHRLNQKSGMFNHLGENQIKEIINASKLSVFFIDEDQKVTLKDIGDKEEIYRWAKKLGASVTELKLESQFRCNGSNGYLAWLDNTLQIRETANEILETKDYDFRIMDSPQELHELILQKNETKNKARMVAGYCWNWITKKHPQLNDIVIGDFKATWNLPSDGQAWIIKPDSATEVGCIHTSQGLEVDYIGVIVGPDFIIRDGMALTQPTERAGTDRSVHGWKALMKKNPANTSARLDSIIKNTYRTLLTRGQKGCYVYFVDEETKHYFEQRIQISEVIDEIKPTSEEQLTVPPEPFHRLHGEEIIPFENCVPLFDLKIAAGSFSPEQQPDGSVDWVELPDAFRPQQGLFVAQVVGESMNKRIPNGSWCLFKANPAGSRQGKIVLVQHREITDSETGGHYTIKIYESGKEKMPDGCWKHNFIKLRPDTTHPGYVDIVLQEDQAAELKIIAELVAVLS